MTRAYTLLFLLLITGSGHAMNNHSPYRETSRLLPSYEDDSLPTYDAVRTINQVHKVDAPPTVVAPYIGWIIQELINTITPESLKSMLLPDRNVTREYFTDGLGAAIIMQHEIPNKEIKEPFHIHARLLGIATPMGFFPCYSPYTGQRNFITDNFITNMMSGRELGRHVLAARLRALIEIQGNAPINIIGGTPGLYAYPIKRISGIRRAIIGQGIDELLTIPERQWATHVRASRPSDEQSSNSVNQAYSAHRRRFGEYVNAFVEIAKEPLEKHRYDRGDGTQIAVIE